MANNILKEELDTYEAHKKELLGSDENKYVLIKGQNIIGVYANEQDAIAQGYQRFLNEPFLVRHHRTSRWLDEWGCLKGNGCPAVLASRY